jgi:hypothetical protein
MNYVNGCVCNVTNIDLCSICDDICNVSCCVQIKASLVVVCSMNG